MSLQTTGTLANISRLVVVLQINITKWNRKLQKQWWKLKPFPENQGKHLKIQTAILLLKQDLPKAGLNMNTSSVIRQKFGSTYQGVRNVRFSENSARFVFFKHPFWDSSFCLIKDDFSLNFFLITYGSNLQDKIVIKIYWKRRKSPQHWTMAWAATWLIKQITKTLQINIFKTKLHMRI